MSMTSLGELKELIMELRNEFSEKLAQSQQQLQAELKTDFAETINRAQVETRAELKTDFAGNITELKDDFAGNLTELKDNFNKVQVETRAESKSDFIELKEDFTDTLNESLSELQVKSKEQYEQAKAEMWSYLENSRVETRVEFNATLDQTRKDLKGEFQLAIDNVQKGLAIVFTESQRDMKRDIETKIAKQVLDSQTEVQQQFATAQIDMQIQIAQIVDQQSKLSTDITSKVDESNTKAIHLLEEKLTGRLTEIHRQAVESWKAGVLDELNANQTKAIAGLNTSIKEQVKVLRQENTQAIEQVVVGNIKLKQDITVMHDNLMKGVKAYQQTINKEYASLENKLGNTDEKLGKCEGQIKSLQQRLDISEEGLANLIQDVSILENETQERVAASVTEMNKGTRKLIEPISMRIQELSAQVQVSSTRASTETRDSVKKIEMRLAELEKTCQRIMEGAWNERRPLITGTGEDSTGGPGAFPSPQYQYQQQQQSPIQPSRQPNRERENLISGQYGTTQTSNVTPEAFQSQFQLNTASGAYVNPTMPNFNINTTADNNTINLQQLATILRSGDDRPEKFKGNNKLTPKLFLRNMQDYFNQNHVSPDQQLRVFEKFLADEPLLWYRAFSYSFNDVQDFRRAFLERYWSKAAQIHLRAELYASKFPHTSRTNFAEYFEQKMLEFRELDTPLPESDMCEAIVNQYPANVQTVIIASNARTAPEVMRILQQLDNTQIGRQIVRPNISPRVTFANPESPRMQSQPSRPNNYYNTRERENGRDQRGDRGGERRPYDTRNTHVRGQVYYNNRSNNRYQPETRTWRTPNRYREQFNNGDKRDRRTPYSDGRNSESNLSWRERMKLRKPSPEEWRRAIHEEENGSETGAESLRYQEDKRERRRAEERDEQRNTGAIKKR